MATTTAAQRAVQELNELTKGYGEKIIHVSAYELDGRVIGSATALRFVAEIEEIVITSYEYTSFGMWLTKNTAWIDPAIVDAARTMFAENL